MLEVLEPGLLTTVQDLGRPEFVDLGVPLGGACDAWSLRVANALVGNEAGAPALEMTLAGPTLAVMEECVVGLAGADLEARLLPDERRLAPWQSHRLKVGQALVFGTAEGGAGIRAYLALAGGLDVPLVLGSASTCLPGGFGGIDGRPLVVGDRLRAAARRASGRAGASSQTERRWRGGPNPAVEAAVHPLRVLPGPDLDRLAGGAFELFVSAEYRVSGRGDRQGLVLEGRALATAAGAGEMLSVGTAWGAVQVPPAGRPICLLADHQTVGGYPVVAVIISADLPALGQLGPGDAVRFSAVDAAEAEQALRRQHDEWLAGCARLAGG